MNALMDFCGILLCTVDLCLYRKQRDLIVEVNQLLNVISLGQTSPHHSYHEFPPRKPSVESLVGCFIQ